MHNCGPYCPEFAYGSHPDAHTGVYAVEPRGATGAAGESLQFRESILLGHTRLSEEQVRDIVSSIGKEFSGKDYDILQKCVCFVCMTVLHNLKISLERERCLQVTQNPV